MCSCDSSNSIVPKCPNIIFRFLASQNSAISKPKISFLKLWCTEVKTVHTPAKVLRIVPLYVLWIIFIEYFKKRVVT